MTAVNTRIDSDTNQKNAYAQVSDYVFSTLYNTQNLEECIEHILEVVGLHFNVSRVYIFENSEDDRFCSGFPMKRISTAIISTILMRTESFIVRTS